MKCLKEKVSRASSMTNEAIYSRLHIIFRRGILNFKSRNVDMFALGARVHSIGPFHGSPLAKERNRESERKTAMQVATIPPPPTSAI